MANQDDRWQMLEVRGEEFFLGDSRLDFKRYYDIKTPKGEVFRGREVHYEPSQIIGSGGMSDSYAKGRGYFYTGKDSPDGGHYVRTLESNFLMRVNERAEREEKLKELRKKKKEIDEQIRILRVK